MTREISCASNGHHFLKELELVRLRPHAHVRGKSISMGDPSKRASRPGSTRVSENNTSHLLLGGIVIIPLASSICIDVSNAAERSCQNTLENLLRARSLHSIRLKQLRIVGPVCLSGCPLPAIGKTSIFSTDFFPIVKRAEVAVVRSHAGMSPQDVARCIRG